MSTPDRNGREQSEPDQRNSPEDIRLRQLLIALDQPKAWSEGGSPHTRKSYVNVMTYWERWFECRYGQAFRVPVSATVSLEFLADHLPSSAPPELTDAVAPFLGSPEMTYRSPRDGIPRRFSLGTALYHLTVLSAVHSELGVESPFRGPELRMVMGRLRALQKECDQRCDHDTPITNDDLMAMVATCDDSLRGLRDAALLLFGWAGGGRRCSEITAATCENTQRIQNGYAYRTPSSNPTSDPKLIVGAAGLALSKWLHVSRISCGPIFRGIRRGEKIREEALNNDAVRKIVKRRAAAAGLVGKFTSHSLRKGFGYDAATTKPIGTVLHALGLRSVNNSLKRLVFEREFDLSPDHKITSEDGSVRDNE